MIAIYGGPKREDQSKKSLGHGRALISGDETQPNYWEGHCSPLKSLFQAYWQSSRAAADAHVHASSTFALH